MQRIFMQKSSLPNESVSKLYKKVKFTRRLEDDFNKKHTGAKAFAVDFNYS